MITISFVCPRCGGKATYYPSGLAGCLNCGWLPYAKQAGFFERLVLVFIKEQNRISYDGELGTEVMLVYKKFRGAIYIISLFALPPRHYNCRCAFIPFSGKQDSVEE